MTAFAAFTAAGIAADTAKNANNQEKLHGTWIVVSAEFDGSAAKCELKKGDKLVFDGKKYKFHAKEYPEEGTFAVDAEKKVKEIDFLDVKDKKSRGIYELNGEEMKLCFWHGERPAHFKSSKVAVLVTLKR